MKKWLVIAIVVLVFGGLGVWYFAFRPPASVPLPALIPARTVFFLTANDLAGFWDNFSAGRFWQEVRASPLYRKGGVEERIAVFTSLFEAAAGFPLDRANFRELFGREVALALLPGEGDRPASLLLVTRVGMKTRALELVSRWRDKIRFSDQQSLQEGEREGIPFVEFRPTEAFPFSSAYAFSGDCLLFLVSPLRAGDQLAEALALAREKGRGASLASLPGFQGMSGSLPAVSSLRLFCYLRTDRLAALWGGGALVGIEAPGVKEWQGLEAHLRQRIGVTRALGGAVWLEQGLRGWLRRELDLEKVKEIYGEKLLPLWRPPSRRFAALRFAPADAAGVWAGTGDFPLLWERARIEWRMLAPLLDESARNNLEGAKKEMARAVETDLLPWLGDEAAILLNRLASPGLLPLPDAALAIRVKDEAAAARGVEKLVAAWIGSRPIVPVKSRRGEREITSIPVAPFFQPAWTLAEGYLIAGTSAATVEKAIGLSGKEGGGLLQNRDFERVTAVVPPEGERFLYLAAARLGDEVAQIVRWWASLTTAKGEGGGGETLLSPEEVIGTLQPWGRLKALAIRARTQQNIVIEDFYWYSEEESFSGGVSGTARQR